MYSRTIKYKSSRLKYLFTSFSSRDYSVGSGLSSGLNTASRGSSLVERYVSNNSSLVGLRRRSDVSCRSCFLRSYCSKGDGTANSDKENVKIDNTNAHSRLGELDQIEWLQSEKLAIERKKKESPYIPRKERFRTEFLRRIVPWEKITVSWDTFPYYINENVKDVLVECTASHLKNKKFTTDYGSRLPSSSGRILLQGSAGTELYRERMVRALARDLQVPLLVLDSNVLAPYDFSEDCSTENETEDDSTSESENEETNEASNEEEDTSSDEENEADTQVKDLKKMTHEIEELKKIVSEDSGNSSTSPNPEPASEIPTRPLKKGDRVKYIGPNVVLIEEHSREISSGQRGEVYEVIGDQVAIIFDTGSKASKEEEHKDKTAETTANPSLCLINVKDVEHDLDAESHDCYVAMEVLCEILESQQPLIVYFPDSSLWLSRAVVKSNRHDFLNKLQEKFDQLSGPVVLICGQNKSEADFNKEKGKFTMILPNLGRLAKLPLSLKNLAESLQPTVKPSEPNNMYKLFSNVIAIPPPKEEDLSRIYNKQIEEDRVIVISRSNLHELHEVLEDHKLSCMDLLHVKTDDVILTKQKAEKIVGWAKNHYLSSCLLPLVKNDRLQLPRESLEIAILRLKEQESESKKPSQNLKNLAKDEYETNFVSAVVPPGEIGVKFDDVGALEEVKKALNELVILPMRRPELFTHGNLLRPCKGILLFGPPGTGKTLLAKALATEAGANFISITGSTLTSKWFGDAEKLTKALFSFASKLAPVIIFVDEVDSLLGARGGGHEHEATRRMRNEFMAAWDGLRSKESQRILILGATNRPFDLDDAVIRRLPRRIYVDLPDAGNRLKILNIMLARENLESGFSYEQLANATDGYSGSDLKNLCIAAAYRPVQELIEKENKGDGSSAALALRPLNLDDFIQSKAKVGPSVAYDASSMNELRKWNDQYGEGGSRRKSPFGF